MVRLRLRVLDILEERELTRYWLLNRMSMSSWRNFSNMIENKTSSIRYDILEELCTILEVPVGKLFEQTEDDSDIYHPF